MGGAMDLVVGAGRVIVTMTATTPSGGRKLIRECTFPLTAREAVDVVVTEQAVFRFRNGSLFLTELLDGATVEDVEAATEAQFDVELEVRMTHIALVHARRTRTAGRPAVLLRGLRRHAASPPEGAADRHPAHPLRGDRPRLRRSGDRRARPRPHAQHAGEPLGERIIVSGRCPGSDGKPPRAAGRDLAGERRRPLRPSVDDHDAPLDPNFSAAAAA